MAGFALWRYTVLHAAQRFARDERGATAIEYAMIAAGVGATIAATVWGFGTALKEAWWDKIANVI